MTVLAAGWLTVDELRAIVDTTPREGLGPVAGLQGQCSGLVYRHVDAGMGQRGHAAILV